MCGGNGMSLIGQEVTVLGAGVAGLCVAQALALRGASVTVLEQADAIREVGAGLQISPNGAAVLRALGLGPALDAASVRALAVELRDGIDGDLVLRLDIARLRPAQGWHFIHRADLIALLLDGAREAGVTLRLLTRIEGVDLSGARPRVITAQGDTVETPLLIGADGLHSHVRTALNGPAAPFFTHQVAWRALVPADPGQPPVAEVHMGPGRHIVSYPLRGGTLRNVVAVEERRRWAEESWSMRDDPMELRLAFKGFSPRVRNWLDQAEDVWLWGLFRHPVAPVWYRSLRGGAVTLLGDAAHPTLPFLAQGANMALEDAWVLAESLGRHDTPQAGLAAYQAARAARSARIVEAANRNARAYHLSGPMRSIAHAGLRLGGKLAPDLAMKRFDWLYGHDVTAPDPKSL
jgi:salicylate hydroxylase